MSVLFCILSAESQLPFVLQGSCLQQTWACSFGMKRCHIGFYCDVPDVRGGRAPSQSLLWIRGALGAAHAQRQTVTLAFSLTQVLPVLSMCCLGSVLTFYPVTSEQRIGRGMGMGGHHSEEKSSLLQCIQFLE